MKRHGKLALFVFLSGIAFGTGVGAAVTQWQQMRTEAFAASATTILATALESDQVRNTDSLTRFFLNANPALDRETALYIAYAVQEASDRYGLPESVLAGLIYTESRANPRATNKGCMGLTQVNWPVWKKDLISHHPEIFTREDLLEPRRSILAGAWILRWYLDRYGDMDRALEAYSGGAKWYPGKVLKVAEGL